MKKKPLYYRITVAVSIIFVIAYFSSLFLTQNVFLHFVQKQYKERIFTIARNLSRVCYPHLLNHNEIEIYKISQTYLNEEDLKFIFILNRRKEIVIKVPSLMADSDSLALRNLESVIPRITDFPLWLDSSPSQKIVVHPVKLAEQEKSWGYVVLYINTDRLSVVVNKTFYTALLISTTVLLIGLYVLYRISRKLTRPIAEIIRGTEQVSQGNFDYHINVEDEGELGQLARKFNEMILKLNLYNKQKTLLNKKLHEYNAKLEEKIKKRTAQLKKIQEEVLLIFHQIPVGLLVVDLNGKILWYNQEFLRISEVGADEDLSNQNYTLLEQLQGIGLTVELSNLFAKIDKNIVQCTLKSGDKNNKIIEIASQPLYKDDKQLDGVIFILKDVTREVNLEKKITQDQRLDSIGKIAGGIAHDFNNILAIILPHAQLLKFKLKENQEYVKYLETIERATERGASLTQQILSFSKGSNLENFEVLNINEIIDEFIMMFRRVLEKKIDILRELDSKIHNIKADRNQLGQILMNLSVNARDAMPRGGNLIFRTRTVYIDKSEKIVYDPNLIPGEYTILEVEDTGTGISVKYQDKVFDPFFTTKKAGKGSGLGLSVVYGLVKSHKGIIDVDSSIGKGTRIRIYFPACHEKSKKIIRTEKSFGGNGGTILIVDDEEMLHDTLSRMLKNLNYDVISAKNGKEAITVYKQNKEIINAILMDIQMPVMDGVESAAKILEFDPTVRIIFTSGYADQDSFDELHRMGYQFFIKKPYNMGILSDIINQALSEN